MVKNLFDNWHEASAKKRSDLIRSCCHIFDDIMEPACSKDIQRTNASILHQNGDNYEWILNPIRSPLILGGLPKGTDFSTQKALKKTACSNRSFIMGVHLFRLP